MTCLTAKESLVSDRTCPSCKQPLGNDSGHFVPPSLGEPGFYTCAIEDGELVHPEEQERRAQEEMAKNLQSLASRRVELTIREPESFEYSVDVPYSYTPTQHKYKKRRKKSR